MMTAVATSPATALASFAVGCLALRWRLAVDFGAAICLLPGWRSMLPISAFSRALGEEYRKEWPVASFLAAVLLESRVESPSTCPEKRTGF